MKRFMSMMHDPDETVKLTNEQTYALIDIIHQKIVGKVFMDNLTDFFETDEHHIKAAIEKSEILGDRFMICEAEIVTYPVDFKNSVHSSKRIDISQLSDTEKRISYIYRHLYTYGNTVTSFNPNYYKKQVRLLGLDFDFIKKIDKSTKEPYYILTKKELDLYEI